MKSPRRSGLVHALLVVALLAGCTIVTPPGDGGTNGNGNKLVLPPPPPAPPPLKSNLLFVVNVHRSTANLAQHYADIINGLVDQLTATGLQIDSWGVAATYPDVMGPRLLFGRRDTSGPTPIPMLLGAAAAQPGDSDYAAWLALLNQSAGNIAASDVMPALKLLAGSGYYESAAAESTTAVHLGANANVAALPPGMGGLERDALFADPRNLFIVVYLQSLQRPCALDSAQCQVDGRSARDIFLDTDADGNATWLHFASGSLRPEQIVHVAMTTAEGVSYTTFRSTCSVVNGFPLNLLDMLEPSPAPYYQPLMEALEAAHSGTGHFVDLCNYMGVKKDENIKALAKTVASMAHR